MDEMSIEKAFEVLGLPMEADSAALKKAYRKCAMLSHPDKATGSEEKMKEIQEARKLVAAFISGKNAIVPLTNKHTIQRFDESLIKDRAARQANESARVSTRRRVKPFQRLKYLAWGTGLISAGIVWFSDNIFAQFLTQVPEEEQWIYKLVLAIPALIFVTIGAILHIIAQGIEYKTQLFLDELGDLKTCAARLSQAIGYRDIKLLQEEKIGTDKLNCEQGHSGNIRVIDQRRLLLLKSVEHGLLVPVVPREILPVTTKQYKVTFKPSAFKPRDQETETEGVFSDTDASSMIVAGAVSSLLFGIPTLLVQKKYGWWALIPGIPFGLCVFVLIGGIIAWTNIQVRRLRDLL